MSEISIWVLSIAGIVVLFSIIDLILPNGKTSGFIKNIFSYVIILVIVAPVFTFLSKGTINVSDIFKDSQIEIQEDFVSSVNNQALQSMEKTIEEDIRNIGVIGVEIGIVADIFETKLQIKEVSVDLRNYIINQDAKNINIKTSIIEIIQKYIEIDKENIIFYE